MLANCSSCGKLINSAVPNALCPECAHGREQEYQVIKDYLVTRPNAKVDEVVRETGISFHQVREFWEGGRLKGDQGSTDGQRACNSCGAPISAGSYCGRCGPAVSKADGDRSSSYDEPLIDNSEKGFKKIENQELKGRMHTKKNI